jgi:hypothetical protein
MVSEPYFDDVNFENISSNFPSNLTYEKLDARNEYILPLILENKSYIRFMTWKVEVKADKLYTLAFGADGPFKFYFDDNGTLLMDICLVVPDDDLKGETVYLMFEVIINYLNNSYRNLMKTIWK